MDPTFNILAQRYGFMLLAGGFLLQAQAVRLNRQAPPRRGRYGPRNPYKTARLHEHIKDLIENSSDRMFQSWFR